MPSLVRSGPRVLPPRPRGVGLWAVLVLLACLGAACATGTKDLDGGGTTDSKPVDKGADKLTDRGAGDKRPDSSGDVKQYDGPEAGADMTDQGPPDKALIDKGLPDVGPDLLPPDVLPTPDVVSPDSKPGKICDNGKDDDNDGKVDCIDLADCGKKKPCLGSNRTLVIHEVSTGSPNYVVLRNASNTWRSIGGWKLELSGNSTAKFTLPVKSLAPGQTITIVEYTGKSGEIGTKADIPFKSGTASTHNNSVLLRSPGNAVVDYVGFGKMLVNIPGTVNQVGGPVAYSSYNPNTQSYYRAGMKGDNPSFKAADWHKYNRSRK